MPKKAAISGGTKGMEKEMRRIMNTEQIIDWLLEGDVSIQYQVHRDLLDQERKDLQEKIAIEGWGKQFLSKRHASGHWGQKFYFPKWTSSHYTLLDLRNLCISPDNSLIKSSVNLILDTQKGPDGGVLPIGTTKASDVCVNGMLLNYASYFGTEETKLQSIVDFILSQLMVDGGFNCMLNRSGATHSSLHSTISVLEGITTFEKHGYTYRLSELLQAKNSAIEFILLHQLFLSDRTGEVIKKDFLKFSYPCRWKYDILRALDYFQYTGFRWDDRMKPAIEILFKKRNKNGTWNARAKHPGELHFEMEKAGKPGRWNTLRALRVIKHFGLLDHDPI